MRPRIGWDFVSKLRGFLLENDSSFAGILALAYELFLILFCLYLLRSFETLDCFIIWKQWFKDFE